MPAPGCLSTGSGEARVRQGNSSPGSFHILDAKNRGLMEASALLEGGSVACSGSITAPRQLEGRGESSQLDQPSKPHTMPRTKPAPRGMLVGAGNIERRTSRQSVLTRTHYPEHGSLLETAIWAERRHPRVVLRKSLAQRDLSKEFLRSVGNLKEQAWGATQWPETEASTVVAVTE